MDPSIVVAVAEIAGNPEFQAALLAIISILIGATKSIGGERFKILRRLWAALRGK